MDVCIWLVSVRNTSIHERSPLNGLIFFSAEVLKNGLVQSARTPSENGIDPENAV